MTLSYGHDYPITHIISHTSGYSTTAVRSFGLNDFTIQKTQNVENARSESITGAAAPHAQYTVSAPANFFCSHFLHKSSPGLRVRC
eukprot:scaffold2325_cov257-Pinguiococcus_pyrenoidosus.AAC.1